MAKRGWSGESADMYIRLPLEMKEWIEREAERNYVSQNSEIIRAIRSRMDSEQPKKATG
jgi:Arc/MetJ-type ribon-helix-helix transcriptional regulator